MAPYFRLVELHIIGQWTVYELLHGRQEQESEILVASDSDFNL
jgi:hypothetical protein